MSSTVPESSLTSEELLRISGFDRQTADHLDAALVSGSGLDVTVVEYTATGAEGDNFVVLLPAARASALYVVGGLMGINTANIVVQSTDTKLVDRFTCKTSAAPLAGDTIQFIIKDIT